MADRWARLIKEPKGLFEKLEIGPQSRVAVVDVRDSLFLTALRERAASVAEGRVPEGAPVIFFGAETRDALRKIQLLAGAPDRHGRPLDRAAQGQQGDLGGRRLRRAARRRASSTRRSSRSPRRTRRTRR